LEKFLEGKPAEMIGLFNYFVTTYKKIGPFDLHPAKTRIAFVGKIRFSGVSKIGKDFIEGAFLFVKAYENATCFFRIEHIPTTDYYIHRFRLKNKKDINPELKKYMKLAYAVGQRKHLKK
jgi:hypothetical protein